MKVIFDTDLSYFDEEWECEVYKHISIIESCGMYVVVIAENDEEYEYVERFEIIFRAYSLDKAISEYKNYGGKI